MEHKLLIEFNQKCNNCGSNVCEIKYVKPHVGLYCHSCKKYIKWLSKNEKRLYGIITPEDVSSQGMSIKTTIIDEDIPW